ncbi:MAG: sulfatase-like hydrolase/transferase [Myxococcales bacterium]|nr:sulfatase-like hydrolase/transferase [Myxococcales bacterium]
MPPYPVAAITALLVLFAVESATVPGPYTRLYGVTGLLLIGLLGALAGLLAQLAHLLMGLLGLRFASLGWVLAGVATGIALAGSLGAFARLGTRYDALAQWTLVGGGAWGLGLATVFVAMQPSAHHPQGWLPSRGPWLRGVATVLLVAAAAAFGHVDHTMYVGLYTEAHVALRVATLIVLTCALLLWQDALRVPQLGRYGWLTLLVLFALPVGYVRDSHADTMQAFVSRPWPAMILRTARGILDLDRDGFSLALGGGDCDELDRGVNPGATEIPDNGVDDNCVFGDRSAKPAPPEQVPVPSGEAPMSVVLVTIDTLRADRVLGRGKGETMPEVREWAQDAVRFHRAYTPGAWTSVAVGSMMRGRYARRLRWTAYHETNKYRMLRAPVGDLVEGEKLSKLFPLAWNDPNEPLAHWLQRRGMKTLAVVDDGFSQMLSSKLGASRGFDTYSEVNVEPNDPEGLRKSKRRRSRRNDATTATMASSLMRFSVDGKRFFLWVHFFGPHTPSSHYPGIKKFGDSLAQRYDHEVRHSDKQVARVLEAVDKLEDPVAVFVTSDHGEKFFERYRSHGADLSDDVLHVPLLAKVPGWTPKDVHTPVSLVDLMPTILALTETPGPAGLDGRNLTPLVQGGPSAFVTGDGPRLLLSDTWQYGRDYRAYNDRIAAYDGERKVVLDRVEHAFLMYEQGSGGRRRPLRMQGLAIDRYARRLLGYLEEAGGGLELLK